MKNFIEKFNAIFSIPELRNRIFITLFFLAIYRLGSFVILPGVNSAALAKAVSGSSEGGGLVDLFDAFTGGALYSAAVFALGIMPYISASIIVQLLGFAVPYFQKLQREGGESGQQRLNQITRVLTIAITIVQGGVYLNFIKSAGPDVIFSNINPSIFWLANITILTAGTIFCMWLGERITDKGIGNGISLLITVGIIATLPKALWSEMGLKVQAPGGFLGLVLELFMLLIVFMISVAIVQAVRKIPLQFAKHMVGKTSVENNVGANRDYLPIKLNAAGVMPIIFAQAMMFIPSGIGSALGLDEVNYKWLYSLSDFKSVPYMIVFFLLVVVFTYVYTALIVNPVQYADHLKRQNAFIPGVKPGTATSEYIDTITTRITLPGSFALGLIAILPGIAASLWVENIQFALFYGGTTLLIAVAVVIDTMQQIEGHLLVRKYDSLIDTGRVKGVTTDNVKL